MVLDEIWYATPQRARSRTKWIVYDDIGSLTLEGRMLRFNGSTTSIARTPERVTFARQQMNLVSQAVAWAAGFPFYWLIAYVVRMLFQVPLHVTVLIFYSFNLLCVAVIWLTTRWTVVTFRAEAGEIDQAYFADGGAWGWRGMLGGSKTLFRQVSAAIDGAI